MLAAVAPRALRETQPIKRRTALGFHARARCAQLAEFLEAGPARRDTDAKQTTVRHNGDATARDLRSGIGHEVGLEVERSKIWRPPVHHGPTRQGPDEPLLAAAP